MKSFSNEFMKAALEIAAFAASCNEVPVGAVLVKDGEIISRAHNRVITDKDPSGHAEIIALREASKVLASSVLEGVDLYVTLEPCVMCAQAISNARVRRVFFGAHDMKAGALGGAFNLYAQDFCFHKPEVFGGIHEQECGEILRSFFKNKR